MDNEKKTGSSAVKLQERFTNRFQLKYNQVVEIHFIKSTVFP